MKGFSLLGEIFHRIRLNKKVQQYFFNPFHPGGLFMNISSATKIFDAIDLF